MNARLHAAATSCKNLAKASGGAKEIRLELQREAKEQQVANGVNVLFERSDRFEKEVGDRLPVHLHEIGDLLVVHSFEVFEENGFLLAARKLFDGTANFDLIFAQQLIPFNFGFDRLIIGYLASFVDVEKWVRAVATTEFLHELVAQSTQEVDGNKLYLIVLTSLPNVNHQVLDGIFNELSVGGEVAGVVEKRAVLFVS